MTNKEFNKIKSAFLLKGLDPSAYPDFYANHFVVQAEREFKKERKRINLCKEHQKKAKTGTYGGCCVCEAHRLSYALTEIDRLFSEEIDAFVASDYEVTYNTEAVIDKAKKFVEEVKTPIEGTIPKNCGESEKYASKIATLKFPPLPNCGSEGVGCVMCWALYINHRTKRRRDKKAS